jgi:hypothetical protein
VITVGIIGLYTPRGDGNHAIECLTNISKGIQAAEAIAKEGFAPFCPMLDFAYFIVGSYMTPEQIRAISLEWIRRCDVVFLCEGWERSENCRAEYDLAVSMGKLEFCSIAALKQWRDESKYREQAKHHESLKVNGRISALEETLKATVGEIEILEAHIRAHDLSMEKLHVAPCVDNGYMGRCPAWLYYSKAEWGKELNARLAIARQREAFTRNEISNARQEAAGVR